MKPSLKEEMETLAKDGFADLKSAGIPWVEWVSAGDGDECEVCAAANGTVQRLKEIKTPWHQTCENDYCRCTLIAAAKP